MKLDFKIVNTMIGNICKDFYLLPTVHINYIEILPHRYYTISLKWFCWKVAMLIKVKQ